MRVINAIINIALILGFMYHTYQFIVNGVDIKVFTALVYIVLAMGVYAKSPLIKVKVKNYTAYEEDTNETS